MAWSGCIECISVRGLVYVRYLRYMYMQYHRPSPTRRMVFNYGTVTPRTKAFLKLSIDKDPSHLGVFIGRSQTHLWSPPALAARFAVYCVCTCTKHCGAAPHIRLAGRLRNFHPNSLRKGKPKSRPPRPCHTYPRVFLRNFSVSNVFFSRNRFVLYQIFTTLHAVVFATPSSCRSKMAGENMDIEVAEKQLKSLDHSEQHYFNRCVGSQSRLAFGRMSMLTRALQLQPPW